MNMKRHRWMMSLSLIVSAAILSGCVGGGGDFCVVVRAPLEIAPETASALVRTDRPVAESIAAQNAHWRENCANS